jgi:hypothetical protein
MSKVSTNKCYNEWFKSIEQILNVLFKYQSKGNVGLCKYFRMTYFHLECQNPIIKINLCLFFAPTFPILLSKPLECKFLTKKINLIILIKAFVLWKNPRF